jgi:hypothetical protein
MPSLQGTQSRRQSIIQRQGPLASLGLGSDLHDSRAGDLNPGPADDQGLGLEIHVGPARSEHLTAAEAVEESCQAALSRSSATASRNAAAWPSVQVFYFSVRPTGSGRGGGPPARTIRGWTRPPGSVSGFWDLISLTCQQAISIGGSKSASSGGVAHAVRTVVNYRSELLTFVPSDSQQCLVMSLVAHRWPIVWDLGNHHRCCSAAAGVDLTHEPLQSGSVQTDRSPPPAQATGTGVGRRSHRAGGPGTVAEGRRAALADRYARRRYRRHPRDRDAARRGLSRHPFIVTDHDVGGLATDGGN